MSTKRMFLALLVIGVLAAFSSGPAVAQTPDGETPAEETVCVGESGAGFGLCNAYCEAMDCHLANDMNPNTEPNASEKACMKTWNNYIKLTGNVLLPCEECPMPDTGTGMGAEDCACVEEAGDCLEDLECEDGFCVGGISP